MEIEFEKIIEENCQECPVVFGEDSVRVGTDKNGVALVYKKQKNSVFLTSFGGGVGICRQNKFDFLILPGQEEKLSGQPRPGDQLVLGTEQFFANFDGLDWPSFLEKKAFVSAGCKVKFYNPEKEGKNLETENKLQRVITAGKDSLRLVLARRAEKRPGKRNLTLVMVLIALLALSIFLGTKKRAKDQLTPPAAEELTLSQPQEKIPSLYMDFNLIKEGFKGTTWANDEGQTVVLDADTGIILLVSLSQASGEIKTSNQDFIDADKIALSQGIVFVLRGNNLYAYNLETGEVVKRVGLKESAFELTGFSGNAYILSQNQIWKYTLGEKSLSSVGYLVGKDETFNPGASMAIDGSIWILQDKSIYKYTQGIRDSFLPEVSNLVDPVQIFTDPGQDNLFILDKKGAQVISLGKDGSWQGNFVWPGMAGVKDIIASDQKIFLLTGSRIYSIDQK